MHLIRAILVNFDRNGSRFFNTKSPRMRDGFKLLLKVGAILFDCVSRVAVQEVTTICFEREFVSYDDSVADRFGKVEVGSIQ